MVKRIEFKRTVIMLIIGMLLLCAQDVFAASGSLDAHLERLASQTANIKTITSDFKQTKYISFMDETLVSQGSLVYRAPAELEWQYTTPVASGLVYKDGKVRMWTSAGSGKGTGGGGAEESIGRVIAEQIINWTTLDIAKLKSAYNISLLSESPLTIRLTPRASTSNSPVKGFKLVFAPNGVDVRQITLYEADEDYTQIDFLNFNRK